MIFYNSYKYFNRVEELKLWRINSSQRNGYLSNLINQMNFKQNTSKTSPPRISYPAMSRLEKQWLRRSKHFTI